MTASPACWASTSSRDGLAAVVSQEPVYDLYRYLYGDGIRRLNSVATPALYDLIDLTPGTAQDSPDYNVGTARQHAAARLPGAQPHRPGRQRRPLLGLLAQAQPDPGRQGLRRAAVPDPGHSTWSADWKLPAGHRIAVRVTDANEDWWIHTPTFDDVKVVGGSVTLPFLSQQRTQTIQGDPGTQLEGYLSETVTVPPETMRESVTDFALPPAG